MNKTTNNNTELAIQESGFLTLDGFDFASIISDEMDGLTATFDRIGIPAGGGTIFEIPGDDPDTPDTVKSFDAVILYHHPMFSYYKDKYTGGSNPPDCGSFDGITGEGNPGGKCKNCPLNQFASGENGGKACKNRRRIYLLREGEVFPVILSLPTGSLKGFTHYLMRLLSKKNKSNAVVTRFSLKKATNNNGIPYSQVQCSLVRKLTAEEYALIGAMSEQVKEMSRNVGYDEEEVIPDFDPVTGEIIEPLA